LTNHDRPIENNHHQWYGFIVPIVFSILGVIAWLVFILLYALYWSKRFSLFQNIILTIVSLAIMGLLIGLMWVVWGIIYHKRSMHWQNQWSAWLTLVSADA
jgi:magnesium-transporting ATPase (P-type)